MHIDVAFRIIGTEIPADHSYALYSSLSRQFPHLHEAEWLCVHRIYGVPSGTRTLLLTRKSRLQLRLPSEYLPAILPLAGRRVSLVADKQEFNLRLGVPEVYALKPSPSLFSSCVVIKLSALEGQNRHPDREMYLSAAKAKLNEHGIDGRLWIDDQRDSRGRELSRRSLKIKDRVVVGYAMRVTDLNDEDSLRLQEIGLGGRRRLGAGIFIADNFEGAK